MAFRVGQKVVCVSNKCSGNNIVRTATSPKKGQVYTVRELDGRYTPFYGAPGVRLVEIRNAAVLWRGQMVEPCLPAHCFRPLIERKTSTGFEILDEIRKRESETTRAPVRATV